LPDWAYIVDDTLSCSTKPTLRQRRYFHRAHGMVALAATADRSRLLPFHHAYAATESH
jgi:hypothetical protein